MAKKQAAKKKAAKKKAAKKKAATKRVAVAPAAPLTEGAMPLDRYWSILDGVRRETGSTVDDLEEFADELRRRLEELPPEDVRAFFITFRDLEGHAYRYDVWGAAYLLNGGCSDDGFVYFRSWLMAQGRKAWDATLENPDNLAKFLPEDFDDDNEFEELACVPLDVFKAKTGQELVAPKPDWHGRKPAGEHWTDDDHLDRLLPRLAKRVD